ncbi:SDR family NAD(P)-dependent oxidoreductase [Chelativorans sp. M5D2P16]|uniref:SDR family NAD(P)-dependent oxidoreductase n=1 Tax=Chelativorans sp. M5D2P16 TaxID=3095678 RepID=UPI002ACAA294|nr:SDR family NAD(P)-dependent oxidoreductase [Chelativorans sp. M5D2P16]MDZ5698565.1 SDR family NAD(P)-dependent oxidoreductase [Chelativorans sp. M5D2P16]
MAADYTTVRYNSLAGARVLVTGGASGIGAELARAFVAQEAKVGILDVDATAGEALAAELGEAAVFRACDLRDVEALRSAIAAASKQLGAFTVLVNNAARDDRHAFESLSPDYWNDCLATNLSHHIFASQAVLEGMKAAGRGSIINMGSVSWMRGRPGMLGYATSKAAINGLTRSLASELGPFGIRVNAVVPGAVLTERQERLWRTPEMVREINERQVLKMTLRPEHVARMVLFLASEEAGACTGQNFVVDAGITLG